MLLDVSDLPLRLRTLAELEKHWRLAGASILSGSVAECAALLQRCVHLRHVELSLCHGHLTPLTFPTHLETLRLVTSSRMGGV
jgi:hypothetical protein